MILALPILAAVSLVLILRWRPVDEGYMIALVALTPFLALPLILADLVAWFSRMSAVRVMAAVVTVSYLATVAPFDAVIGCQAETADDPIVVMTANVLKNGGRPETVAAEIVANDPDVVVMQEVRFDFAAAMDRQPGLDAWTFRSHRLPDADNGVVVWSKWPATNVEFGTLNANSSVTATIESPYGQFRLAGVHTLAPTSARRAGIWNRQFVDLQTFPTDRPAVMAGDFNATEDHHPFRTLLDQGWTDVHDNKGCGLDQTWPATRLPVPIMRLDHILVTDDFDVLSTEIGEPGGSDHFPVISRMRLVSGD